MARKCMQTRNEKRIKMVERFSSKREKLLKIARDRSANPEEIFKANMELAGLPRNSSPVRIRNRCALTGRARGYYRRFGISRIKLRELANKGQLPGVRKSSW